MIRCREFELKTMMISPQADVESCSETLLFGFQRNFTLPLYFFGMFSLYRLSIAVEVTGNTSLYKAFCINLLPLLDYLLAAKITSIVISRF